MITQRGFKPGHRDAKEQQKTTNALNKSPGRG
jgi:hypothetical protein